MVYASHLLKKIIKFCSVVASLYNFYNQELSHRDLRPQDLGTQPASDDNFSLSQSQKIPQQILKGNNEGQIKAWALKVAAQESRTTGRPQPKKKKRKRCKGGDGLKINASQYS